MQTGVCVQRRHIVVCSMLQYIMSYIILHMYDYVTD